MGFISSLMTEVLCFTPAQESVSKSGSLAESTWLSWGHIYGSGGELARVEIWLQSAMGKGSSAITSGRSSWLRKGKREAEVQLGFSSPCSPLKVHPALLPKCHPADQQHVQAHLRQRQETSALASTLGSPAPAAGPKRQFLSFTRKLRLFHPG